MFPADVALFDHTGTAFGLAPEAVNIDDIIAGTAEREFEEAVALSGLEEDALFLSEAVSDAAATNLRAGGLASAKFLNIVFAGSGHEDYGESREMFQAEFSER